MVLEGWVPVQRREPVGRNHLWPITCAAADAERTCSRAVAGCEDHRGTPATYRYTADSCCGCNYSQSRAFRP